MMKSISIIDKIRINAQWYLRILGIFIVVFLKLLFYYLFHPKEFKKFLLSLFATLNEVYQHTHGQLRDFHQTQLFQEIRQERILAQANAFNIDLKVMRPVEVQILASLVTHLKPRTIFEFGTYSGFTTLHFACNSPSETKIYTLDLPPNYEEDSLNQLNLARFTYDDLLVVNLSQKNVHSRLYKDFKYGSKINELFGDSMHFDFSPYRDQIDFIFIDGNHSRRYVESDTKAAMEMISAKGVIVWHDYDYIHRDIFKYLNELSVSYPVYSVANSRFAIYGPQLI